MDKIKLGVLLPHEIFASMHAYNHSEIFYATLAGSPAAPSSFAGIDRGVYVLQFIVACLK